MTSFRPTGDKAWNYVRENDKLRPFLRWVPQGPNLFECTVTEGWPSKVASNRADGSYATKDLFEPHPSIPRAWKYIARLDDTIVLSNGEKFNPVMMEGRVRSHPAVTETTVFGSGRPYLGILIVPSPAVTGLLSDQIIDQIFPVIEEANQTVEAYARISRDMVKVLPHDCQFPRTDKGSIIRQAFYKRFDKEINDAYDQAATSNGDVKALSVPALEDFVRSIISRSVPEEKAVDRNTDLFSLGLDSLQSIQMRTEILKAVDIGSQKLGQNVVFEYPSIAALSAHLFGLRTGEAEEKVAIEDSMQSLVEKYGSFTPRSRTHSIVVTGATGSLGAHVVAQLAVRPDIANVYCLVRARSAEDASIRVRKSLVQRKVYHTLPLSARSKVIALPSDLSDPHLRLSSDVYRTVTHNLRSVIHCAWSVNFNLGLASFEKDCIAGVRHLLDLCHAVPSSQPASFDFCSSVSTVARCPSTHTPEVLPELEWAQNMGYAQSKLVAERLCMKAAETTGIRARVLRVGQIVADTVHGVWNATEGIPLMMQTALTVGALPRLQETPSWTPVDIVAKAISEIALSDARAIVANVTNAKTFDWTSDLLPALRMAGLQFDEVEPKEWVRQLRASNQDPLANPPVKLVDFFAAKYDRDSFPPSRTYETSIARSFSPSLDNAPALDCAFVAKFVRHFQATAWKQPSPTGPPTTRKRAIILAGPCGSGKASIAKALAARLDAPFVEGDTLHAAEAVSRMSNGTALLDSDRILLLDRVKRRILETLNERGRDTAVVACSALKKAYRDRLRGLREEGVEVQFVDLQQVEVEELKKRREEGTERYAGGEPAERSQTEMEMYEPPNAEETDVLPVDTGCRVARIVEEIEILLAL